MNKLAGIAAVLVLSTAALAQPAPGGNDQPPPRPDRQGGPPGRPDGPPRQDGAGGRPDGGPGMGMGRPDGPGGMGRGEGPGRMGQGQGMPPQMMAMRNYFELVAQYSRLSSDAQSSGVAAVIAASDILKPRGTDAAIAWFTKILPDVKNPAVKRAIQGQLW